MIRHGLPGFNDAYVPKPSLREVSEPSGPKNEHSSEGTFCQGRAD